ncbi:MAG: transaldolase family protein [Parachlamydiaceae bacterium]
MELWLDTVEIDSIRKAHQLEVLDGVTTNPTLLSQIKGPIEPHLQEILNAQESPLAIQVTSSNFLEEAKALYRFSSRIIPKVPATAEGYAAIRELSEAGIPVMATAIFEPQQLYLALKLGATYAAFYYGRIEDAGKDPIYLLKCAKRFKSNEGFDGKLLAAGIRTLEQFTQVALEGCDAITLPSKVFQDLLSTPSNAKKTLKEMIPGDYQFELRELA